MAYLGVTEWCLDCRGAAALYRAAEFGLEAIHIDAGTPDEHGALPLSDPDLQQAYLKASAETGVHIIALAINTLNTYGICNPAEAVQDLCRRTALAAVTAAAALAIDLIFVPSFHKSEIRDEQDLVITAQFLQVVCDAGAQHNIRIATENSLNADGNLELLRLTSRSNLFILLDTLNPALWGHSVAALVDPLWPMLCGQIHAKDGVDGVMGNAALGEGIAEIRATADALRDQGYTGHVILENQYQHETARRISADIAMVRALFPELNPR